MTSILRNIVCTFFLLLVLDRGFGHSFDAPCDEQNPCPSDKFLKCGEHSVCECENPDTQIYDAFEDKCLSLAGYSCDLSKGLNCIQGAECISPLNTCKCAQGFYQTELSICQYNIGKECTLNEECDAVDGLECRDGICKCPAQSVWQLDYGCSSPNQILKEFNMTTTTTTDAPQTSTEDSTSTPIIEDVDFPEKNDNDNDTEIEFQPESLMTTDIQDNLNIPTGGGLAQLLQQITPPILNPNNPLNPLNPNRQRPWQQRPSFNNNFNNNNNLNNNDLNNNNFASSGQQQQSQQKQQQLQQQKQQQQQQNPNGAQPGNVNRPGQETFSPDPLFPSDSSSVDNNFPLRRLLFPRYFRRLLMPLKRLLFPRLVQQGSDGEDLEIPSPIWLVASSINQVLPVLRSLDRQFSPFLQNIAYMTRPRYWDKMIQNRLREQQALNKVYQGNSLENEIYSERNRRQQNYPSLFPLFGFRSNWRRRINNGSLNNGK